MAIGGSTIDTHDPFAELTAPPPGETPSQKAIREKKEVEAKRISERIDDEIKAQRAVMKKQKDVVKVLLLGQSESGKSTTLKNFRMKYAKEEWLRERAAWRAVIQLNLVRSINTISDTLQAEMDGDEVVSFDDDTRSAQRPTSSASRSELPPVTLTDQHQLLRRRLGPLRRVEADLKRLLGAGTEEVMASNSDASQMSASPFPGAVRGRQEFQVGIRSWKDVIERAESPRPRGGSQLGHDAQSPSQDATEVIAGCRDDMKNLWADNVVKTVLRRRNVNLENAAGFFLDDLDRIATRGYEPSDDDIVRARLRTLGIQEYRIKFERTSIMKEHGLDWTIYDVGGSRTARRAWLPYFENVNAIIFLAPISCFDESLLEDPSVNRLEDSFIIWRAICSSKLLERTTMICFLNKCDLLRRKLKEGVRIQSYLPSYGDRANDSSTAVKFMRERFKEIVKKNSPSPRATYLYPTSVTDTKATATTLVTVRDGILREHLKEADFV